ncbi:MAG: tRNA (guanosine(37)-N1)-methyltransferase TrmD [Candidatus Nomurabacteria bacterium]|nr:tRNA (guanosine(37)-N1)-methyltransferase TrmD [Candidatus Nomurabacteria bacterium]
MKTKNIKTFKIITLFPDMFEPVFGQSMIWKAQKNNLIKIEIIDLRRFGMGVRKRVDDTPYGGGDGMLLMCEPIFNAVKSAKKGLKNAKVIITTPKGETWQQKSAKTFSQNDENYIILCGHYEGFDERIMSIVDYNFSLGNFVLTGGEIPAMAFVDSISRLIPGVLGGENSAQIESFANSENLLEYPQYTRPEIYKNLPVPEVLLSGNHAAIAKWREANFTEKQK